MVLRWAKELNRKDLDQLDGTSIHQAKFVPTAEDYAELVKENEKLKRLFAEQAWETDITYGRISGEQRFFFLMSISDVSDRYSNVSYGTDVANEASLPERTGSADEAPAL